MVPVNLHQMCNPAVQHLYILRNLYYELRKTSGIALSCSWPLELGLPCARSVHFPESSSHRRSAVQAAGPGDRPGRRRRRAPASSRLPRRARTTRSRAPCLRTQPEKMLGGTRSQPRKCSVVPPSIFGGDHGRVIPDDGGRAEHRRPCRSELTRDARSRC